MYRKR